MLTVLNHTSIDSINSQPNNNSTHFQIHKIIKYPSLKLWTSNKKAYKILQMLEVQFEAHTHTQTKLKNKPKKKRKNEKDHIFILTWQLISKQKV